MVFIIRSWVNNIANKFPLSICSSYFPLGYILINSILYVPSLVLLFSLGKYNLSDKWWSFEILSILGIVFSFLSLDYIIRQFTLFNESIEFNPLFKNANEKLFKRLNNNKIPIIIYAISIFVLLSARFLFNSHIPNISLHIIIIYAILLIIFITVLWLMMNYLYYLYNIRSYYLDNRNLHLLEDLCYKIFFLWIIGTSLTFLIAQTFIFYSIINLYIAALIISIELIVICLYLVIYKKIIKLELKAAPNINAKIWLASIINLFPFDYPMFIFISGYIFYFIGIIIINSDVATSNRWFYYFNAFILGNVFTFTVFRILHNSLFNNIFKDLEFIFRKNEILLETKNVASNLVDDNMRHAKFSIPMIIGVPTGVILGLHSTHLNESIVTLIIKDPALLYLTIVCSYAGAVIGTGISLVMRYGDLADEFEKIIKIDNLNKNKLLIAPDRTFGLKSLGNFIVKSALIWFIGLAIISFPLINYMASFNKYLPLIYLVPTLVGLITFFYVYLYVFNGIIKQLQLNLIEAVSSNIVKSSDQYEILDANKKIDNILMFTQLNEIYNVEEYTNTAYNTLAVMLSTTIGLIPFIFELHNKGLL